MISVLPSNEQTANPVSSLGPFAPLSKPKPPLLDHPLQRLPIVPCVRSRMDWAHLFLQAPRVNGLVY